MLKKLSAIILVALILIMPLSVLSAAAAAPTTTVSFAPYIFLEDEQKMQPRLVYYPGDCIYVGILFARTENLGGYTIKLAYDTNAFTFQKGKLLDMTGVPGSEFVTNDVSGTVYITWETTQNYTAEGVVLYVPFTVNKGISENRKYEFNAQISEVFQNNANQSLITTTISAQASVILIPQKIPQEFLDLVTPLLNVSYNPTGLSHLPVDSLWTIKEATKYYSEKLSATQQKAFSTQYPDLYEALSNALNRYYELANKEASALVEAEVQNFLTTHAEILAKAVNDITLDDKAAVDAMAAAYDLLSDKAVAKLDENVRNKVKDLKNRIKKFEQDQEDYQTALVEVEEYLAAYGAYVSEKGYNELLPTFKDSYINYAPYITEAQIVYDSMLSPIAQEMLSAEKARIDALLALVDKYTKDDADAAALVQRVNEFVERYVYVFTLNKLNVGLGDESAIKMVIDMYNALTDEPLKEALKTKITSLNSCLEAIEVLKNATDGEVVIVPDDDQSTTEPETIVKVNTIEKLINRIYRSSSVFRMAFIPLLILLMLSILCLAATIFILQNLKKKNLAEGSALNETV